MSSPNNPTSWTWTNETLGWKFGSNEQAQQSVAVVMIENSIFISLTVIQCALLHPKFQHSSSARWIRLSLAPVTIVWWLCYPFRPSIPLFRERNFFTGVYSAIMVFKSIEWAFATGPYYIRTLKIKHGVPVWEKDPPPQVDPNDFGFGEFVLWITLLFSSQRGMRWSWGPVGKGNTNSFARSVVELIRLQLVTLPCLAFVLCVHDRSIGRVDSAGVLLDLGVPPFPGVHVLANCLLSTACMLLISSSLEMMHIMSTLGTYLLYPLATNYGLPSTLVETLNPANYPPQFGPLFVLSSVSHFWGKTWHQKIRRPFLFCGGKPAMALARFMGASTNVQKMFGVMGVFALSGIFHEYLLYAFQQAPHPQPRVLFETFPGNFLFFFLQSFGVILEPFILPHLPKRCAKLWTASFLLLTAPLFTHEICQVGGPLHEYRPLSQWNWRNLLVPVPLVPKLLPPK